MPLPALAAGAASLLLVQEMALPQVATSLIPTGRSAALFCPAWRIPAGAGRRGDGSVESREVRLPLECRLQADGGCTALCVSGELTAACPYGGNGPGLSMYSCDPPGTAPPPSPPAHQMEDVHIGSVRHLSRVVFGALYKPAVHAHDEKGETVPPFAENVPDRHSPAPLHRFPVDRDHPESQPPRALTTSTTSG